MEATTARRIGKGLTITGGSVIIGGILAGGYAAYKLGPIAGVYVSGFLGSLGMAMIGIGLSKFGYMPWMPQENEYRRE